MFRFHSMMARTMFLHVVALVITAIFMPLVLYWFLHYDVDALQRRKMREQAEALARHLTIRPDGGWSLDLPASLQNQYSEAYGRYAYAVLDSTSSVLFSSREDRTPIFPAKDFEQAEVKLSEARRGGRIFSGITVQKELNGRSVWMQVAEDLAHRDVLVDDIVANFFQQVGWVTIPILLVLFVTDALIFRGAIRPLLRASDRAKHISPMRIDVRLPLQDIPKEIRPLVTAVNQALDRLEHGFRRQREFTADVAHELRTPLAILRTRVETLPDQGAGKSVQRDIERMNRVIDQLLDAAELETILINPNEKVDLRAICAETAELIAPLALGQEKNVALSGTEKPVWINGNAEMLRRAIRNLVENALNHTPKGTDVEIVVEEQGTVSVLDHGEGVSSEDREQIFERFWRRDRGTAGAGLGLSIVKRIVEWHGGTITVKNRPTVGADFSIHFPLAEPPEQASQMNP